MNKVKIGIIIFCLIVATVLIGFLLFKKPPSEEEKPPSEEEKPPSEEEKPPSEEEKPPSEEEKPPSEKECPSKVNDDDYIFGNPQLGSSLLSS